FPPPTHNLVLMETWQKCNTVELQPYDRKTQQRGRLRSVVEKLGQWVLFENVKERISTIYILTK
ncbi:hypothetical protein A2U01_0018110, partial [Trifolium medium]|nr:hypothetical protein [Trifolium medium]